MRKDIEPVVIILLAAGGYVGWNIGANDTANCVGTSIGCGLLSFKRAVLLVGIFSMLGAVLQGEQVMKTISSELVQTELGYLPALVALVCSGFFVSLATFMRIPTSTSQAIVGGITGISIAIGTPINYPKLITIAQSWLICPLLVMALSAGLYFGLKLVLHRINNKALLVDHFLGKLAILSSCYVAYSMGANNAGNAVGLISGLDIFPSHLLLAFGGMTIALGAITYGKKVSDTVGKGITNLDVTSAFIAQAASALGLHLFSMLGIPVSTSSAIVGAVIGVGLVNGVNSISTKTICIIVAGWVVTPVSSALVSLVLYNLVVMIIG